MPVTLDEPLVTFIGLELKSKCGRSIKLLAVEETCYANRLIFNRTQYITINNSGLGGIGRNKGFLGFLGGALCCVPFNYRILSIAKFGAEGMPGGKTSLAIASLALGAAGAFADLAVPTPAWTMPKRIWGVKVPPVSVFVATFCLRNFLWLCLTITMSPLQKFHADDNVVVPIVSGYACTKIFQVLGWPKNLELAQFIFV